MDDIRAQASRKAQISKRVRDFWEATGIEQVKFATDAGISPTTFNNYVTGYRVGLDGAIKLCLRYGLTLDWIYFGLQASALPPDVREKIVNAQRETPAKPPPPPPPRPVKRRPFRRAS